MKKVRLGKTNLLVSQVGIGEIPLTRPTEEEAVKLIQHTLDLVVNFVDSAFGYGISEERIGKAIVDRREQVILATKGRIEEHLKTSLERLKTDYIDLWQFHGVNSDKALDDIIKNQLKVQLIVLKVEYVRQNVTFNSLYVR